MSSQRGLSSALLPLRPSILPSFSEPSTVRVVDDLSQGAEVGGCAQRCVYLHMEPCSRTLWRWLLVVVLLGSVLYYSGLNTGRYPPNSTPYGRSQLLIFFPGVSTDMDSMRFRVRGHQSSSDECRDVLPQRSSPAGYFRAVLLNWE